MLESFKTIEQHEADQVKQSHNMLGSTYQYEIGPHQHQTVDVSSSQNYGDLNMCIDQQSGDLQCSQTQELPSRQPEIPNQQFSSYGNIAPPLMPPPSRNEKRIETKT